MYVKNNIILCKIKLNLGQEKSSRIIIDIILNVFDYVVESIESDVLDFDLEQTITAMNFHE